MESENPPTTPEMNFTGTQSEQLGALQSRYQQDGGLFSVRELSYLRFMRWLLENSPVGEDSRICGSSQMPVGSDFGGMPWCVL